MPLLLVHARYLAHHHDDVPAFHAVFLVTTFLAAALFPLGYFAALIGGHMLLDWFKYREIFQLTRGQTFRACYLESGVDIALLLLSLSLAVVTDHTLVIASLSGMLRAEATVLRSFALLLPRMQIAEHFLALVLGFHAYLITPVPGLRTHALTRIQWFSLWSSALMILGILAGAMVTYETGSVLRTIAEQLSFGL